MRLRSRARAAATMAALAWVLGLTAAAEAREPERVPKAPSLLAELGAPAAERLLAASLSAKGLALSHDIMRLNETLGELNQNNFVEYGEGKYWLTVMGEPSADEVNEAYRAAAASGPLAGVLEYSDEPLVSTDIVGSPASCTFDSKLTMTSGNLVKVFGWYDNEWGYSNRLVDIAKIIGAANQ